MILIKTIAGVKKLLSDYTENGLPIGFVPTMGALHDGHLSLLKAAKSANQVCICSIFVNPTQFNNPADFEKYPVTIEKDIDILEGAGCDILFLPSVAEMYPAGEEKRVYALGELENMLEGKFRPGHFQGVCQIVDKLLDMINPTNLYLGSKDFQQCMVIKKMIGIRGYKTNVQVEPTVREKDGLAMSSRNLRLNEKERKQALWLSKALTYIKENIHPGSLENIRSRAEMQLTANGYKVDYITIADAATLAPVAEWDGTRKIVALAAAYLNDIRLIDNMLLN